MEEPTVEQRLEAEGYILAFLRTGELPRVLAWSEVEPHYEPRARAVVIKPVDCYLEDAGLDTWFLVYVARVSNLLLPTSDRPKELVEGFEPALERASAVKASLLGPLT